MAKINFIVGHQYRVLKPGYYISCDVPAGPGGRKFLKVNLNVGDVIEYVGYKKGYDNYPGEWFKKGEVQGDLEPSRYGWVEDPDLLEEVSVKKKGPLYPHIPPSSSILLENSYTIGQQGGIGYPPALVKFKDKWYFVDDSRFHGGTICQQCSKTRGVPFGYKPQKWGQPKPYGSPCYRSLVPKFNKTPRDIRDAYANPMTWDEYKKLIIQYYGEPEIISP